MADAFQATFSNSFSWMKMLESQLEFHWNLFHGVQLTIIQHWFRLAPIRRQAIIWANYGTAYGCIYASSRLNELTLKDQATHLCCIDLCHHWFRQFTSRYNNRLFIIHLKFIKTWENPSPSPRIKYSCRLHYLWKGIQHEMYNISRRRLNERMGKLLFACQVPCFCTE